MEKQIKYLTATILCLLIAMSAAAIVVAQDQPAETIPPDQYPTAPNPNITPPPPTSGQTANVVVAASLGGNTNPVPGAYVYNYGSTIKLQATPNSGYKFLYWSISGSYTPGHNAAPVNLPENAANDPEFVPTPPSPTTVAQDSLITTTNPLSVICGYGYTYVYQPIFAPIAATTQTNSSDAVVTILQSTGGTTNPGPGTYHYSNGTKIVLQATPDSGYSFVYWVAVGADGHPTTIVDNPTNIICGYGYTYTYQAMFSPSTNANVPTSSAIPTLYLYIIIAVLAIVAVVAIIAAVVRRRK